MRPTTTLVQIRRSYVTDCGSFRLTVDTDADGWMACVRNCADVTLYAAQRCSLRAAQSAATEFATYAGNSAGTPEAVARQLEWRVSW